MALRWAGVNDLDAINRLIESAIGSWGLPERVQRLSLPLYRYNPVDLQHLTLMAAEVNGELVGVAAWEPAESVDAPAVCRALLLHGLYVDPARQRQGIGRTLLAAARAACREARYDGLLVKAQPAAVEFFQACGLERLPVVDPERHYHHRLWAPNSD